MSTKIADHQLVPKHTKINDSEKEKILASFHVNLRGMPKIAKDDPAIESLGVKAGDLIKIERESKTAGVTNYYRVVER